MKSAKPIVIGNWKMNPQSNTFAQKIFKDIRKKCTKNSVDVVVCPPYPFLSLFTQSKKPFLGAQNISHKKEGALTGEVSISMLKSLGVSFVIVGHSERRETGETSDIVAQKARLCLDASITPIICIGEKVRDGSAEHWQEIKWQLVDSLQGINRVLIQKCIIAYEPVWAIGKSKAMSPEDVEESVLFIKKVLVEMFGPKAESVRVLYGGSVDDSNALTLAGSLGLNGFLVGRSSLNASEFSCIVDAFVSK